MTLHPDLGVPPLAARPSIIANGAHVRKQRKKVNKTKTRIKHEKPNLAKHGLKHG